MSSPFAEKSLLWQDLRPELELDTLPMAPYKSFLDLQERAQIALLHFLHNPHRTLLALKSNEQAECAEMLAQFVAAQMPKQEKIIGVRYEVQQGDSFSFPQIFAYPAESQQDNFAAKKQVATVLYCDPFQLFGSVQIHSHSKDIQLNPGLVHQLNQGVLILSAAALLQQFDVWHRLKHLLHTQIFDWHSVHPFKNLPCDIPSYPLSLKVILLGSRDELATLAELEPELYPWADYSELEHYYWLTEKERQQAWASYVQNLAYQYQLPTLSLEGLNRLYQLLVRESEERQQVTISPRLLKKWLVDTALVAKKSAQDVLTAEDFDRTYAKETEQQGYLQQQTYANILNEQVYVATDGEIIGQVNGLSVIEYQGTPMVFGEPSRMSCIVQFGEGEIVDVERKNELAGNIHSKGMMIAEACLANILTLPSQLPFSASLVFEQSYAEIDGDSASLASFCVLVSALAELPLPQSIALTGTIDQFGLVHSVGGVNAKIEGFFAICQQRGLTGKQGVIIPSAVISQLSLNDEVLSAVKNQAFFIYPVEDVYQACNLLFQRDLVEEEKNYDESNQPISRLINQRIESSEQQHHKKRWWHWLSK